MTKRDKQSSCDGKRAFETRSAANESLRSLNANRATGATMSSYKCDHCGKYHVGHNSGKSKPSVFGSEYVDRSIINARLKGGELIIRSYCR